MTETPSPLNVAFAALRSAIPSTAKAVNIYHRGIGAAVETSFAFHDTHLGAEAALNAAMGRGDFIRGVTFARGLLTPPTAWVIADAFDSEN